MSDSTVPGDVVSRPPRHRQLRFPFPVERLADAAPRVSDPAIVFGTDPFGTLVRASEHYWQAHVLRRHPAMAGKEGEVAAVIADPSEVVEVRRLLYLSEGIKVVATADGCLVTAFPWLPAEPAP